MKAGRHGGGSRLREGRQRAGSAGRRKGFLLFGGVFWGLVMLGGCGRGARAPAWPQGKAPRGTLATRTLVVDGVPRRYALYLPATEGDGPYALVLELHGGGVTIEDMTGESGYKTPYKLWMPLADAEGVVVVYPEGLPGAYGKPTWNDCRGDATVSSQADDVRFIGALLDHLLAAHPIDPRRVYVSGTSNGGLMALRLAVAMPTRLAAVAAVAAAMPARSECPPPTHPLSVLFMNGTRDTHLPYAGGTVSRPPKSSFGTVQSTAASVALWVRLDRASPQPTVYRFPDRDPRDGSTVVRYTYAHGVGGTQVVLYRIEGGGHAAPSIAQQYSRLFERRFGRQNHDIEMVQEVWQFFRDKRVWQP